MWVLLLPLLLLPVVEGAINCTVGTGGEYSSLQDALNDCREPNVTVQDIDLLLSGTFMGPFDFPLLGQYDTLLLISEDGNPATATLEGGNNTVPISINSLSFAGITFDLLNENTTGLFFPQLSDANVTFMDCAFRNYPRSSNALIRQVDCNDQSTFIFDSNDCTGFQGKLFELLGMHSVIVLNNNFSRAGLEAEDFMIVDQNKVSQGIVWFENNTQYMARYSIPPSFLTSCLPDISIATAAPAAASSALTRNATHAARAAPSWWWIRSPRPRRAPVPVFRRV
jgi:hypothetical protein